MMDAVGIGETREGGSPQSRRNKSKALHEAAAVQAGLAQIIEGEILPRLARAHRKEQKPQPVIGQPTAPERVTTFAQALIANDPSDELVRELLDEDLPLDVLLLDLLAPAARHIGELWEKDEADFIDVTVALGRLHSLACKLCASLEAADAPANGRRVLLCLCPGERHLFSLTLVASFFREAGWDVVLLSGGGDNDPVALVRDEHFDLVGVSLSCDVLLPTMVDLVAAVRAASCNPDVRVMIGGPLFLRDPASAVAIGADAAAEDGRSAIKVAQRLFMV